MKRIPVVKRYRLVGPTAKRRQLHRVRAELALGKPLPPKAIVHHADGSRADDAPLVICQDDAYHKLLHIRMRVKAAGGNPNTDRICSQCGLVKRIEEFSGKPHLQLRPCRPCENLRNRIAKRARREQKRAC
jgi:hypothetical protein